MAKAKSSKPKPAIVQPSEASSNALAAGAFRRQAEEARGLVDSAVYALRCATNVLASAQTVAAKDPLAASIFAQYGFSAEALAQFQELPSPLFEAFPSA